MPAWPRSTMDSIRVSEAPDTGSIPVEATIFTRGKWFSKTRNVPAGKGRDEIAFFKVIQDLRTDFIVWLCFFNSTLYPLYS